jgi:UDP-N-acetylmuramoyl-tripeptide--D-alanyl-D-alanine ligase
MKRLIRRLLAAYLFFWARVVLRARRPLIVGITGSVGKTTTTEVVAAALMHPDVRAIVGPVWKTPHNMNNTQGVPLVILGHRDFPASHLQMAAWLVTMPIRALVLATIAAYPKLLVLEFAAGSKGDISRTAALASPTVSIVTAIGPAHLEYFGTMERIAQEKGALVRHTDPAGLVILGGDSRDASALDRLARARVVKVSGRGRALSMNVARVVCDFFGVPATIADRAVAEQPSVPGRLHIVELGYITIIDDSYNANPLSMELGLETLAECATPGRRRVAILGDMKELGGESSRYHADIAAYARSRSDVIVAVGPLAKQYAPDHWFATSTECVEALPGLVAAGDYVLVKGSRSIELERVVNRLKQIARATRSETVAGQ